MLRGLRAVSLLFFFCLLLRDVEASICAPRYGMRQRVLFSAGVMLMPQHYLKHSLSYYISIRFLDRIFSHYALYIDVYFFFFFFFAIMPA